MKKVAFTLCSNNYLAQARVLAESMAKYNPEFEFVIGLVDEYHQDVNYQDFAPARVVQFREIGYPELDQMIAGYNIIEFNTAVKPFYFEYLLSKVDSGGIVVYFDPDIEVFAPLSEVCSTLQGGHNFVLTPHLVVPSIPVANYYETLVLNVGLYNLGFIAMSKTDDTAFFVRWWKERLRSLCKMDPCSGLFVDQIWVNYLPIYFRNVYIAQDAGYNVAYWNFHERRITENQSGFFVNETDPLIFFHFSSFTPLAPDTLCSRLDYSFEARPDLVSLYKSYTRKLLAADFKRLSQLKTMLNFKPIEKPLAKWKTFPFKVLVKLQRILVKL